MNVSTDTQTHTDNRSVTECTVSFGDLVAHWRHHGCYYHLTAIQCTSSQWQMAAFNFTHFKNFQNLTSNALQIQQLCTLVTYSNTTQTFPFLRLPIFL